MMEARGSMILTTTPPTAACAIAMFGFAMRFGRRKVNSRKSGVSARHTEYVSSGLLYTLQSSATSAVRLEPMTSVSSAAST